MVSRPSNPSFQAWLISIPTSSFWKCDGGADKHGRNNANVSLSATAATAAAAAASVKFPAITSLHLNASARDTAL